MTFTRDLERSTVVDRKSLVFQYELILEASRNPAFRAPVADLYRAYLDAFTEQTAELPEALTRAWFATFDGLVLQLLSGAVTPEQFADSLRAATGIITSGTATPDPDQL
ncbi:hypothetical protein [Corynebacterium variabile]|uniref:hypothetical protein n=1 Tax=Corynebacterium variabile TaxID=1727 RepID=UPI00289C105E|nr:hypothetical protein [Corynebacterium variabile]